MAKLKPIRVLFLAGEDGRFEYRHYPGRKKEYSCCGVQKGKCPPGLRLPTFSETPFPDSFLAHRGCLAQRQPSCLMGNEKDPLPENQSLNPPPLLSSESWKGVENNQTHI